MHAYDICYMIYVICTCIHTYIHTLLCIYVCVYIYTYTGGASQILCTMSGFMSDVLVKRKNQLLLIIQ